MLIVTSFININKLDLSTISYVQVDSNEVLKLIFSNGSKKEISIKFLGSGTSGSVIRISSPDTIAYALKYGDKRLIKIEYDFFRRLEEIGIYTNTDLIINMVSNNLFSCGFAAIALEMHGTNLFEFLKVERTNLTPDEYLQIFKDIMMGLKYLHDCNMLHRDIKPENILIERNLDRKLSIKICDLGLAIEEKKGERTVLQKHVVSRFYRAPEVTLCQPYSKGVDVFAAATVFAEMINILAIFQDGNPCGNLSPISEGKPALELDNPRGIYMVQREVIARMTNGTHPIIDEIRRIFPSISDRLISFLLDMLNPNPEKRISAAIAILDCDIIRLESTIGRSESDDNSFANDIPLTVFSNSSSGRRGFMHMDPEDRVGELFLDF